MILDLLPTLAQIRFQADQLKTIPPEIVEDFRRNLRGDQSDEYYLGFFQGVAASIMISQQKARSHDGREVSTAVLVPVLMAFLADELMRREIVIKDHRYKQGPIAPGYSGGVE